MSCGHPKVEEYGKGAPPGAPQTIRKRCASCGHEWREHSGELLFAQGQPTLTAALLLTPRDERTMPVTDERCAFCGHYCETHDLLGGCMYHDSDGPCVCAGFRSN